MKFNYRYILIISMIIGGMLQCELKAQNLLNKIVIDAGHGGKDPGASGKFSREKDVVLAVALKTGERIKKMHPDVEIVYTRKTDVFIPLKERAEIANKSNADLFISIHCNANASSQPHGSETYVMGLHKSEANLNVAKTENAAILFEEDYEQSYDGFDPTSDESHIIFNFFQNSFQVQNLDLATKLQTCFTNKTPLKNRGVKQAGFWVLYKTTMPGVLIETGFLSNSSDEKFLNSKDGQAKLSLSIANAVSEYKKDHDNKEKLKLQQKGGSAIVHTEKPKTESNQLKTNPNSNTKSTQEAKKTSSKKVETKKTTPVPRENAPPQKASFHVQFLSLSNDKQLSGAKYDKLPPISSYYYKGMYRYISGKTESYEEAVKLQSKVRKAGFKDAFLVAFYQGKRITLKEAKKKNGE